eukprot:g68405.t1
MEAVAVVFLFLFLGISLSHPCDKEQAEHCLDVDLADVGACLLKQDERVISQHCQVWLNYNEACLEDIKKHCADTLPYTEDVYLCLTRWTHAEDLSPECVENLPKQQIKADRAMSEEEQKRAEARRNRRKDRAADVKKYHKNKEQEVRDEASKNQKEKEAKRRAEELKEAQKEPVSKNGPAPKKPAGDKATKKPTPKKAKDEL